MSSWTQKIKAHGASKQPKARKPRALLYSTIVQTRTPDEETGDPGAVKDVHYTFDGITVTLADAKGKPIEGTNSYVVQPGETAERIATRMALAGMERRTNYAAPDAAWVV